MKNKVYRAVTPNSRIYGKIPGTTSLLQILLTGFLSVGTNWTKKTNGLELENLGTVNILLNITKGNVDM